MRRSEMKRISHSRGTLHIEVPEGIINIYSGLHDAKGRSVTSISFVPDDRFAGEPKVRCHPSCRGVRMVRNKR